MNSVFNNSPEINIRRSRFDLSHSVKCATIAGQLTPMGTPIEVLPGDTFTCDLSYICRLNPSINVPVDNCYLEVAFWFVPNRLVWNHWQEFCGENKSGEWVPTTTYQIPQININYKDGATLKHKTVSKNDVAAHMGLKAGQYYFSDETVSSLKATVNALPFRALALIWNENYRDEFTQDPILIDKGDTSYTFVSSSELTADLFNDGAKGGFCPPVARYKDYFSTATPQPQFGDPVRIPLNNDKNQAHFSLFGYDFKPGVNIGDDVVSTSVYVPSWYDSNIKTPSEMYLGDDYLKINPNVMGTINELRIAVQTQKFLEKMLYGNRYVEFLYTIFGVVSPDARLQRPEYLGGFKKAITMNTVVQTSESGTEAKGSIAGYSSTTGKNSLFTWSSTEHGYIIPLYYFRAERSYCQKINKLWSRKDFLDFYNPIFSRIGNVPILKKELYVSSNGTGDLPFAANAVFGYQEAWNEYRFMQNENVGYMAYSGSNDIGPYWSYCDVYDSSPTLGDAWMREGYQHINRTLAVTADKSDVPMFINDFFIELYATRPMPVDSEPGLMDHF